MSVELVPDVKPIDPAEECEAASRPADFHRIEAAKLHPDSDIRALMLRCAARWSEMAGFHEQAALEEVR